MMLGRQAQMKVAQSAQTMIKPVRADGRFFMAVIRQSCPFGSGPCSLVPHDLSWEWAEGYHRSGRGGMAEWLKAAVLKTVRRKPRGFESLSLRQPALPM